MTTQTEALKLALEALIGARAFLESDTPVEIWSLNDKAITAIKEALAQPEQEPVAWAMLHDNGDFIDAINQEEHARIEGDYKHALYTTPPQRTAAEGEDTQRAWVGLTDDEMFKTWLTVPAETEDRLAFGRAVEAKLKAKNERKEKNTLNGGCL